MSTKTEKEVLETLKKEIVEEVRSTNSDDVENSESMKKMVELTAKLERGIESLNETFDKSSSSVAIKSEESFQERSEALVHAVKGDDEKIRALTGGASTDGFLVGLDISTKIETGAAEKNNLDGPDGVYQSFTSKDTKVLGSMGSVGLTWGNGTVAGVDLNGSLKTISIHKVRALVKVQNDDKDDSEADIMSTLIEVASDDFARGYREKWTNGSGTDEPKGFMKNSTVLAAAIVSDTSGALGSNNANILSNLRKLQYSLDEIHAEKAVFIMNRVTLGVIADVTNAAGNEIYNPVTNMLLGMKVLQNASMDNIGSDLYPIACANLKSYKVYKRKEMSVQILSEKYADESATGVLFTSRQGAGVGKDETGIKILKCLT